MVFCIYWATNNNQSSGAMSEVKQPRGGAVIPGFVSPGLQSVRERVLFGVAIALTVAFLLLRVTGPSGNAAQWARVHSPTPITHTSSILNESRTPPTPTSPSEKEITAPQALTWMEEKVTSGDTLSTIFKRAGFSEQDVYNVVNQAQDGESLARIFPGQTIAFSADEEGELLGLRYIKSPLETVSYELTDDGFVSHLETRSPDTREALTTGVITSSLFMAGEKAGLSQSMIMDMANIFSGVVDFALDPRRGDTMELLYEELFLDGEKIRDGDIIAASFTNQGETFTAFRYTDSSGDTNYYNEDGVSMRKAFLMAPLDFTRISSNFNMHRLHPILGTQRPHRGTDYAAPTGTPVYAAGDGRVIKAGYSSANGNYVFIQHGERYVTRYLHLQKRMVTAGQRVAQSQVIGTVGSTGLATGPHLHYEFLVDGVQHNPRTIFKELPKAKTLPKSEMADFQRTIARASEELKSLRSGSALAMSKSSDPGSG